MQDEVHEVPKASLLKRAFGWENARDVLGSGFGIYHGAISRVLLERIQALGGGRTFEHPIIDYDNIFKVIMHGRRFVYCRRPLSIQGVCPASNSAAATDPEAQRRKQDAFDREHKSPVDAMECYRDFPFHSRLGLVSCILMTQHWFGQKYGHAFSGHEKNVVNSAMIQCGKIQDRVEFDRIANGYRQAFRAWHRGKYLPLFKPVYAPQKPGPIYRGYLNNAIFMTDDHPAFDTIASFYGVASSMLTPVRDLSVDLGRFSVVERPRKQA